MDIQIRPRINIPRECKARVRPDKHDGQLWVVRPMIFHGHISVFAGSFDTAYSTAVVYTLDSFRIYTYAKERNEKET
jgi:hypothetical protein